MCYEVRFNTVDRTRRQNNNHLQNTLRALSYGPAKKTYAIRNVDCRYFVKITANVNATFKFEPQINL